jgi:plasmid stabilization system protein ParE
MENRYVIYSKAQEDLEDLFKYISENLSNSEAAMKLIEKFEDKFKELALFPKAYPMIYNKSLIIQNLRKCIVDSFLVVYLYNESKQVVEMEDRII